MTDHKKVLKKIESKEEYFKKLKEYKKQYNRLFRKAFTHLGQPDIFINKFENLMSEMVFIGLVTEEWSHSQRMRLYNEMNKPSEFKHWVEDSFNKIKNKVSPKRRKEMEEQLKEKLK